MVRKCLLTRSLILLPSQHPVKTYGYAFFFSLTGYFGISFVLALIKLFGALVAVTGEISHLLNSHQQVLNPHCVLKYTHKNATFTAKVLCLNSWLLFVVLLCSDHRQKGNDHRTFLHVLCKTFHFSVSAVTFWPKSVYPLFNLAPVDLCWY